MNFTKWMWMWGWWAYTELTLHWKIGAKVTKWDRNGIRCSDVATGVMTDTKRPN